MSKIKCSVGIFVYNEDKNLQNLINSLLGQTLKNVLISEFIFILSGSTDKSIQIIRSNLKKFNQAKLVIQKKREGKVSAVNLFIRRAKSNVLLLVGADLILSKITIEKLVNVFNNPEVGMSGAHPVPVNNKNKGFSNFAVNLLWDLHHEVSLIKPKMGEVVAFRKVFTRLPVWRSADEASIEPLIIGQGYQIKYISSAVIHNKGPDNIKEFLKHRIRNHILHQAIIYEQGYKVATLNFISLVKIFIRYFVKNFNLKLLFYSIVLINLEFYAAVSGWYLYRIKGEKQLIWEPILTSKDLTV